MLVAARVTDVALFVVNLALLLITVFKVEPTLELSSEIYKTLL